MRRDVDLDRPVALLEEDSLGIAFRAVIVALDDGVEVLGVVGTHLRASENSSALPFPR